MSKNVKFLHVSSYAPPHGGAASVMAEQVRAQIQFFHDDVTVISFEPGFSQLATEGAKVIQLRGISIRQDWLPTFTDYFRIWQAVGRADTIVLHSCYYVVNCVVAVIARLRNKSVVCIHHGHLPSEFRNRLNIRFMNRLIDTWLILDPSHRDFLSQYVKKLRPTSNIQNGIWLQELRAKSVKRNSKIVKFIYCGRLADDKGIRELAIAAKACDKAKFIVVGDGPARQLLSGIANVECLGFLDHEKAIEQIAKADCLILPSYHETFPMVIIEALALGVPVISTDINSTIHDLVFPNGLLIPIQDTESLVAAIQLAMETGLAVTNPDGVEALDWSKVIPEIRKLVIPKR